MSGAPIVYLHGFASGPGSQKAIFFRSKLAAYGWETDVPDLAEGDFENLTLTGQLRVIERTAAGRAVILIGSSMGGYLAALYAARHPEVRKLVLMAPAFGFARRWTAALGTEKLAEWRRTGCLETYHYAEKRPAKVGYRLIKDGAQYEEEPDVAQPTLIFHGRNDAVVPVAYSREFAAGRPNVRLEVFDSGHDLLDVLERMWELTRGFL